MDTFTERMLERTQRRQELLASTSLETPVPNKSVETSKLAESVVTSISPPKSPITRHQRRTRLAELASRVDQWLEEDQVLKPNEKNSKKIGIIKDMSTNHASKQQVDINPKSVSFVGPTSIIVKTTKTFENGSPLKQQPTPQVNNNSRLQQLRQKQKSPENNTPSQWQSPNLAAATMTVAQRRALFEKNISSQQNVKPTTTTNVTISLTKTTPIISTTATTIAEEVNSEPTCGVTTPPHPIPISLSTPPSRRGTRPRMSPAVAAASIGNLSTQKRHAWTPPCIKNVLLKKQLHKELDDEPQKTPEDDIAATAVATSSPLDTPVISSADRIAMSVGRVRFKSPSPTTSLYPDLSLVEDNNDKSDKETVTSSSESQLIGGYKRRSNGNHALNSSTTSSESVCDDDENTEILCAKRSRCESNVNDLKIFNVARNQEAIIIESSPNTPVSTTIYECNNSSVLSTASMLSLPSTSFTYYPSSDKLQQINENDNGLQLVENYIGSSGDQQEINTPSKNTDNEPPLVHSVSIYRKQQQMLRSSGTPSGKQKPGQGDMHSCLLHQQMMLLEDDENDNEDDDEDYILQDLERAAARAWHLERTVVPEQDRIIEQATQALNICDIYRQRSGHRNEFSSKFSPEHVHAERLLLIAGLRRTDAVREAQRLRVERTLLPGGIPGKSNRHLNIVGNGKTLVIESLRVPILSSVINSGNNKSKYSAIEGMENQTRWPGGYRYFVCAVRAAATLCRPPMTAATRPADALEESVRRFSVDTYCSDDGISYGYVEFITKKQVKSSGTRKCAIPSEAEGAPIMINGLDNNGWKVTVELYGLSPTATGDLEHHNSNSTNKEQDTHENKSVLDKLWSTVKTPNKDFKKHHSTTASTCIESPGGPTAVRNTVFRQLGYFIFSDGQVDRQQFTLNKIHQSSGILSTTKGTGEETVRVRMQLLEEGENYTYENIRVEGQSASSYTSKKLLTLPPECKQTEGFLTLFDDHELRSTSVINRGQQWQRRTDIAGGSSAGTTLWRRLWFRVEIVNQPQQQKTNDNNDEVSKIQQQTIVLRYWMYPEHAEQQRQPLGAIDLSLCLWPQTEGKMINDTFSQNPVPAAPAPSDMCARPNTLRLLLYNGEVNYEDDHDAIMNGIDDPLLLSADTADERREWCDTVNAAVNAIREHHKCIKSIEVTRFKQEQQDKENELQHCRQHEQQRTGAWPTASFGSGKSSGKKKKLYK